MSAWWLLPAAWVGFLLGFCACALFVAGRDPLDVEERIK